MSTPDRFLYFAYGSNLLGRRIQLDNPTAVRKTAARLDDYRLDFNHPVTRWCGCVATIVPDPGRHVWGAIWELDTSDMATLDEQEGVDENVYEVVEVKVTTLKNEKFVCRSYKLTNQPSPYGSPEQLPSHRKPSKLYLQTIIQGAIESKVPKKYIQFLKSFKHNGFAGPSKVPGLNINMPTTE